MPDPVLSVVIPSVNGWSDLRPCLEKLDDERGSLDIEVLVPDRVGGETRELVSSEFPWVRLIPVAPGTTIPMMRAVAFDEARAPSVAVIEDHVQVRPGWAHSLLNARRGSAVIGGSVANAATTKLVDWAAFLCEYSHLLPPLPSGPAEWVTGNNTLYDRATLIANRDVTHAGRWENHLHDTLREAGIDLISHPEIIVDHKKHYTFWEYFTQRYLYSRSYAGTRLSDATLQRRLVMGIGALALPPVLLFRVVSRCLRKEVSRSLVWRSMPYLVLFVSAWGIGEVVGSLRGAGDSLEKVT
jgi:hypothetical protein